MSGFRQSDPGHRIVLGKIMGPPPSYLTWLLVGIPSSTLRIFLDLLYTLVSRGLFRYGLALAKDS